PNRRRGLYFRMRRKRQPDAGGARKLSSRLGTEHHHRRRRGRSGNINTSIPVGHRPGLARHRFWRCARPYLPKIVDWYMEGRIEIDPMITHTMPLSDINKAFALMREGKSIRSVIIF